CFHAVGHRHDDERPGAVTKLVHHRRAPHLESGYLADTIDECPCNAHRLLNDPHVASFTEIVHHCPGRCDGGSRPRAADRRGCVTTVGPVAKLELLMLAMLRIAMQEH